MKEIEAYINLVDWQTDIEWNNHGPHEFFLNKKTMKKKDRSTDSCGIMKVKIIPDKIEEGPNFDSKNIISFEEAERLKQKRYKAKLEAKIRAIKIHAFFQYGIQIEDMTYKEETVEELRERNKRERNGNV